MSRAPIRIAIYYEHLFPESRGGGERLYCAFAEEWTRSGSDVTYVTREHEPATPPVDRTFRTLFIAPGSGVYDETGTRSAAGALEFSLAALRTIRRRRDVDDALMVSSTPALLPIAARAALLPRGSSALVVDWLEVWTFEQWREYLGAPRGAAAWLVQGIAVWATPLATCHSALTESRLKRLRPRLRVLRSPGLLDPAADDPASRSRPPTATSSDAAGVPPYGLFVGRLIPDKNVLAIPAAIAEVRRRVPGFRAVIVGSGPLADALSEAITRTGQQGAIAMRSGLTDEELSDLMAGAACLIHPSRREGYGLVVVEAAARGTPSVVLDAPSNAAAELVDAGRNGVIAPSTRPEDLAQAILTCLDGGAALRATTRAWYEEARETRSIRVTARRILDMLQRERESRRS